MFQSTVNLFGNSTSLSIHKLKKILRLPVPQDQLNKINNIPGWNSCEKTVSETSSTLYNRENTKNFSEGVLEKQSSLIKTNFIASGGAESVVIENEKPSNNIFEEEFPFFNSEKKSLSKSLSFNSLNLESSKVNKILKRSSSFSDMEKGLAQNFETRSKLLLHKNEQPDIYFMDSAVQCKMSQSSQSVFEMPLTERMELLTASKENVRSEDFDNQVNSKLISICEEPKLLSLPVANVLKTISKVSDNKIVNREEVIEMGKKEASVENVAHEESYVSHSIPSAQPSSEDARNDVALTLHQKTSRVDEPSVALPSMSSEKNIPTSKRKRYNKSDKDSKKLKSLTDIDISYSSEQIRSMIELMRLFNKL